MKEYQHVTHEFPPVYDRNSRILILGSFPSVKSREQSFYYGHPQNRFWKVLAMVLGETIPAEVEGRTAFVHQHGIALWDVIEECDIIGSSDASIRNVIPTDISRILDSADIRQIYTNGAAAHHLYQRYQQKSCGREAVRLPSTSPANASWSTERLAQAWACVGEVTVQHAGQVQTGYNETTHDFAVNIVTRPHQTKEREHDT